MKSERKKREFDSLAVRRRNAKAIRQVEKENAYLRQRIGDLVSALEQAEWRLKMFALSERTADRAFAMFRESLQLSSEAVVARKLVSDALAREKILREGVEQGAHKRSAYVSHVKYAKGI